MATSGDSQWDGGVGDDIPNELDETQSLETCAGHAGSSCAERSNRQGTCPTGGISSAARGDCKSAEGPASSGAMTTCLLMIVSLFSSVVDLMMNK